MEIQIQKNDIKIKGFEILAISLTNYNYPTTYEIILHNESSLRSYKLIINLYEFRTYVSVNFFKNKETWENIANFNWDYKYTSAGFMYKENNSFSSYDNYKNLLLEIIEKTTNEIKSLNKIFIEKT